MVSLLWYREICVRVLGAGFPMVRFPCANMYVCIIRIKTIHIIYMYIYIIAYSIHGSAAALCRVCINKTWGMVSHHPTKESILLDLDISTKDEGNVFCFIPVNANLLPLVKQLFRESPSCRCWVCFEWNLFFIASHQFSGINWSKKRSWNSNI